MAEEIEYTYLESPVGRLLLVASSQGLLEIRFENDAPQRPPDPRWRHVDTLDIDVVDQLKEYFAGERQTFDLPLSFEGTDFQRTVWQALCDIPYGTTITYGELARRIGQPMAVRAVGAANGRNPLPIVVPCHRVIGSNGTLTGYGGGLEIKKTLLDLERVGVPPLLAMSGCI